MLSASDGRVVVRREPWIHMGTAHIGFLCSARASAVDGNRR